MDQDDYLTQAWDHEAEAKRYERLHQAFMDAQKAAGVVAVYFAIQGALATRRRVKAERLAQAAQETREMAAKVDEAFRDAEAS